MLGEAISSVGDRVDAGLGNNSGTQASNQGETYNQQAQSEEEPQSFIGRAVNFVTGLLGRNNGSTSTVTSTQKTQTNNNTTRTITVQGADGKEHTLTARRKSFDGKYSQAKQYHGDYIEFTDENGRIVARWSPYSRMFEMSRTQDADILQLQIIDSLNNNTREYLQDFGYLDEYGRLIDDGGEDFRRKYRARQDTTPEGKNVHPDNLDTEPIKKRRDTRSWLQRWNDYKKERKNYERTRKRVQARLRHAIREIAEENEYQSRLNAKKAAERKGKPYTGPLELTKEDKARIRHGAKIIAEAYSHVITARIAAAAHLAGMSVSDYHKLWKLRVIADMNENPDAKGYVDFNPASKKKNDNGKSILQEAQTIIHLTRLSDTSTVLHEFAHIFLRDYQDLIASVDDLPSKVKKDWLYLTRWLGISDIDPKSTHNTRTPAENDRMLNAQEKFAIAFEQYYMTGKAPKSRLQRVFNYFRDWLSNIYGAVQNITYAGSDGNMHSVELSPEVKRIFGRMLTGSNYYIPTAESAKARIERTNNPQHGEEFHNQTASGQDNSIDENEQRELNRSRLNINLPFNPNDLRTETGNTIDEAHSSELLVTPDGSTALSYIDAETAQTAGIQEGEIQANVGILRHAEQRHGQQIMDAGYDNVQTFLLDTLNNWREIREGTGNSLWLVAPKYDGHGAVAALRLRQDKDGIYRVSTLLFARDRVIGKKELLFAGRPSPAPSSGSGMNLTRAESNISSEVSAAKGGLSSEQSLNTKSQRVTSANEATPHVQLPHALSTAESLSHDSDNVNRRNINRSNDTFISPQDIERFEQLAFHGTGHIILNNRFGLEYIGSGDGRQLFGWGIYFSQNPSYAAEYRENGLHVQDGNLAGITLKNGQTFRPSSTDPDNAWNNVGNEYLREVFRHISLAADDYSSSDELIADIRRSFSKRLDIIRQEYKSTEALRGEYSGVEVSLKDKWDKLQHVTGLINALSSIKTINLNNTDERRGNVYKADIPENDTLLDWDKAIEHQPGPVRTGVKRLVAKFSKSSPNIADKLTRARYGRDFYRVLEEAVKPLVDSGKIKSGKYGVINRADMAASLMLNQAGIFGNRFIDEGEQNFVIWNTDMIRLLGLTNDSSENAKQYFREQKAKSLSSPESYKQIIGIDGARRLDEAEGVTIRMDNLRIARRMERKGIPAKTMWAATGWMRGADRKWRYEIPYGNIKRGKLNELRRISAEFDALAKTFDSNPNYTPTRAELERYNTLEHQAGSFRLTDVFDAPALFAAYPDLRNIIVLFADLGNTAAQYDPQLDTITINRNVSSAKELRTDIIHETQHAVQTREGFALGSNYDKNTDTLYKRYIKNVRSLWDGFSDRLRRKVNEIIKAENNGDIHRMQSWINALSDDEFIQYNDWADAVQKAQDRNNYLFSKYERHSGETEARNSETRSRISKRRRQNTPLDATEDISRNNQIIGRLSRKSQFKGFATAEQIEKFDQLVTHATGHIILGNRFDLRYIGTGEGGQAFGHGIYFEKNQEVADIYRKMGLPNDYGSITITAADGTEFHADWNNDIDSEYVEYYQDNWTGSPDFAMKKVLSDIQFKVAAEDDLDFEQVKNSLLYRYKHERQSAVKHNDNVLANLLAEYIAALNKLSGYKNDRKNGNIYFADIPENYELLNWDAKISEQSEQVKANISRMVQYLVRQGYSSGQTLGIPSNIVFMAINPDSMNAGDITGGALYQNVFNIFMNEDSSNDDWNKKRIKAQTKASALFNKFSIPGHRYFDRISRSDGKGTHNFVIWNMDRIKLLGISADSDEDARKAFYDNVRSKKSNSYSKGFMTRADVERFNQLHYHGTGHVIFDNRFDLQYIGTGEGGAAFGAGFYFAEHRKVADGYRKEGLKYPYGKFSGWALYLNDGRIIGDNTEVGSPFGKVRGDIARAMTRYDTVTPAEAKEKAIESVRQDYEHSIKRYRKIDKNFVKALREQLKILDTIDDIQYIPPKRGNLYNVSIPENYELLDWDNTLDNQPEKVARIIAPIVDSINNNPAAFFARHFSQFAKNHAKAEQKLAQIISGIITRYGIDSDTIANTYRFRRLPEYKQLRSILRSDETIDDLRNFISRRRSIKLNTHSSTGEDLYHTLANLLGSQLDASMYLNSYGIPGHRYWDKFSRDNQQGTHNFVIWNTDWLKIVGVEGDKEAVDYFRNTVLKQLTGNPDETYNQVVGEDGARRIDRAIGADWLMYNLELARKMKQLGFKPRSIRRATGWELGHEERWKYEVRDGTLKDGLKLKATVPDLADDFGVFEEIPFGAETQPYAKTTLGDILDAVDLFAAYPEMRNTPVTFIQGEDFEINGIHYPTGSSAQDGTITLEGDFYFDGSNLYPTRNESTILSLLHEIQHNIQRIEGFAGGSNFDMAIENSPKVKEYDSRINALMEQIDALYDDNADDSDIWADNPLTQEHYYLEEKLNELVEERANFIENAMNDGTARNLYMRSAGETEARNIMTRHSMTEQQRRDTLLRDTEDFRHSEILDANGESYKQAANQQDKQLISNARNLAERYGLFSDTTAERYLQHFGLEPADEYSPELRALLERNRRAEPAFRSLMDNLHRELGGELILRKQMKSPERIIIKANRVFGGNISKVGDVWAGTLAFDTEDELLDAFSKLRQRNDLITVRNRWTKPKISTGYRDIISYFRLDDGTVVELQLQMKDVQDVKDNSGHFLYEFISNNQDSYELHDLVWDTGDLSKRLYSAAVDGTYKALSQTDKDILRSLAQSLAKSHDFDEAKEAVDDITDFLNKVLPEHKNSDRKSQRVIQRNNDSVSSKYIQENERSIIVAVSALHPTERVTYRSTEKARLNMDMALRNSMPKREPLTVRLRHDGGYDIIGGNNTYAVLKELGAEFVPVEVLGSPYNSDRHSSALSREQRSQLSVSNAAVSSSTSINEPSGDNKYTRPDGIKSSGISSSPARYSTANGAPSTLTKYTNILNSSNPDNINPDNLITGTTGFTTPDIIEKYNQQDVTHATGHISLNNRMSLDYLHSGEGSNALGAGIYFEQNPKVAEHYRRFGLPNLGKGTLHVHMTDGRVFSAPNTDSWDNSPNDTTHRVLKLVQYGALLDYTFEDLKNVANNNLAIATNIHGANSIEAKKAEETLKALDNISYWEFTPDKNSRKRGNIYNASIPDNDVLLNWDALLDEQPVHVKKAIEKINAFIERLTEDYELDSETAWEATRGDNIENSGGQFYNFVANIMEQYLENNTPDDGITNPQLRASLLFHKFGVPGHRYWDAFSRYDITQKYDDYRKNNPNANGRNAFSVAVAGGQEYSTENGVWNNNPNEILRTVLDDIHREFTPQYGFFAVKSFDKAKKNLLREYQVKIKQAEIYLSEAEKHKDNYETERWTEEIEHVNALIDALNAVSSFTYNPEIKPEPYSPFSMFGEQGTRNFVIWDEDMIHILGLTPDSDQDAIDYFNSYRREHPETYHQRTKNDSYGAETYYQIGAKRKHEMDIALSRHRPDMTPQQRADAISEIEKLGESVRQGGNPKVEKIAAHWLLGGHIILPEDNYKILDAIRISEQEHFDPMRFDDPNEILAKYTIRETTAERRINPDTVPEFSNKVNYHNGITVYTVDDTEEGQAAVRSIIDTHWGEDANPWCLAARTENQNFDEDEYEYEDETEPDLTQAWEYWSNTYNAVDKRIAFRNGKLLAFCASDDDTNTWWDREDHAHEGIPYTTKQHGNTFVYIYNETTGQSIKIKETLSDGTLREWYENGQLKYGELPDGTQRDWYENGLLKSETLPDGTKREWSDGTIFEGFETMPDGILRGKHNQGKIEQRSDGQRHGQLLFEQLPDGTTHRWNDKGQLLIENLPDGTARTYYESGKLKTEQLPDERVKRGWYESGKIQKRSDGKIHGQLKYEISYDGTAREWYESGRLHTEQFPDHKTLAGWTVREWYDNESKNQKKEFLPDGTKREWFENGSPKYEQLPNGTYRTWFENGNLEREYLPNGTERIWYKSGQLRAESIPDRWKNFTTHEWHENGQLASEQIPYEPARYWDEQGNLTDEAGNLIPDETNSEEVYNQTANDIQEANNYFNNYRKEHPDKFITPDALAQMERYDQLVTHATGNIIWNNRFDLRFVGSSEGSAAFGVGAYFAENPKVSEHYRRYGLPNYGLGVMNVTLKNGRTLQLHDIKDIWDAYGKGIAKPDIYNYILTEFTTFNGGNYVGKTNYSFKQAKQKLKETLENTLKHELGSVGRKYYKNLLAQLRQIKDVTFSNPLNGNIYQFDIPEDYELLDWDKPLSEQPEQVKKAIRKMISTLKRYTFYGSRAYDIDFNTYTGKDLYETIRYIFSTIPDLFGLKRKGITRADAKASWLFNRYGIPGHRYLDAYSRDAGEGYHNFVIWNMDRVKMVDIDPSSDELARKIFHNGGKQQLSLFDDDGNPAETYQQIIGIKGARAIDRRSGNTWLMDNLDIAIAMKNAGKSPSAVRLATGWELGYDNEWKYEIQDGNITLTRPLRMALRNNSGKLPYSLELKYLYNNQELFDAYPALKDLRVEFSDDLEQGILGFYQPDDDTSESYIAISTDLTLPGIQSTLIHEIQHAVQNIEGFAEGGTGQNALISGEGAKAITQDTINYKLKDAGKMLIRAVELYKRGFTKSAERIADTLTKREKRLWDSIKPDIDYLRKGQARLYSTYHYLGGEIEARNVQAREHFTPEQRRRTLLSDTQDENNWLITKNGAEQNFSVVEDFDTDNDNAASNNFLTPEKYQQLVYHGTANIIRGNRFDLRFAGSSEGGAAFGYGAYFAENPATSESYRHEGDPNLGKFGISVTTKDGSHFSSNLRGRTPMDYVLNELLMRFWDTKSEITPADVKAAKDDMLQSAQKLLKERKHTLADYKRNPQNYGRFFSEDAERETIKNLTEEIDALKSIADISLIPPKKGNVYLFDIPENNVLMDWDAHMTQQPDNVKAARKAIIQELKDAGIDTAKLKRAKTGEKFYRALTETLQGYSIDGITDSQQKASYMLNKHGVPGHRFLDSGSRDAKSGTHNFVIWNTKTITMLGVEGNPEAIEHFRNTALQKLTGNPNETYNQFIGEKGMDRLAIDGRFSALGTADTLENAKQLDAKHMPVSFIWKSTGWIKGKDGEWRTEIPDGKLSDAFMNNPKRRNVTLKDVYDNDILYSAYPDLVSMKITIKPMKGSTRAYYSPSTKSITINRNSIKKGVLSEVRLDIIHEIQHAIQDIEGFATGSSSDKKEETKLRRKINKLLKHPNKDINKQLWVVDLTWAFIDKNNPEDVALLNKRVAGLTPEARAVWQEIQELRSLLPDAQRQDLENYKRSAGEVEARNSETRADFDTDRRRNTPPTLSEDTPRSKQILNRYGNNSSFLTPEKYDQLMHHGSKNILLGNRFDLRWLSSGEGHQSFGYGAYLAEEIRVSQTYRKAGMSQLDTADTVFIMKDGRQKAPNEIITQLSNIADKLKKHDVFKDKAGKISWDFEKYIESHIPAMRIGVLLQDLTHGMNSDKYSSIGEVIDHSINKMLDEVHEDINHGKYAPRKFLEMWNNGGEKLFRELIAPLMPAEVKAKSPSKGNVYLFDGPENDELLDWDAPMSEQPKNVLDALKKGGLFISNHETGEQLYRRLSKQLGSDILASMKLNELGIPGHRFWDELSRLTKSGTHNFVIWNTDTLRLLGLTDDSDNDAQDYYRAEDYSRAYLDSLDNNSDIIDYSDRDYDYDTAHIDDLAEAQSDALDNSPETFYQQVRLWQDTVDAVLRNDINPDAFLKVINPPDVLRLIGLNPKPLYMNAAKILRIRADHKTIFRDILGQIPYAISDPVAIFNDNRDGHRNIMIMTDIIDMYGNSVVVPVNLAYPAGKRIVTRLATVYSVGRHNRLAKLFEQGNILYLNRQKAAEWENRTGRKLPLDNINAPFNENDLAAFTPQNEKRRPYRKFPSVIQINARQNNNSTAETYSQSANDNLMDSNIVRSAEDFLTHEARQQVDALRRKYQGTSMWLKAPNGNDTKLSELQWLLVRTDNFKAWFGDWEYDQNNASKVIDKNGEPLVVYHGSEREDFSIFDTKGKNHSKGAGSFFSDSKDVAETFVSGKLSEDKIFPVFLNIRNPYIIGGSNNFWSTMYEYHVYDNIRKRNIFLKNNGSNFQSKDDTEQYISNVLNDPEHQRYTVKESYCMTTDDIARFAWNFRKGNKKRFDGVIIRNVYDIGYPNINGINPISDEFIIPKPNQIKSATRNNGQYSTHNQEIYKQSIGEYGAKAIDNANGNSALMDNLRMAQEMHRRGIKPRTIKRSTGWELGIEGKWKYELQDGQLRNPDAKTFLPLREFYDNEPLFLAYPKLNDINVAFDMDYDLLTPAVFSPMHIGHYDRKNSTIHLQSMFRRYFSYLPNLPKNDYRHEEARNIKAWLVSEIQRIIQPVEGFAVSRSQRWFDKRRAVQKVDGDGRYYPAIAPIFPAAAHELTAGETEAANAGRRAEFTQAQRRNSLLTDTEDVPRDKQLIIQNGKKKRDFDAWADDYANAQFDAIDNNSETYNQSAIDSDFTDSVSDIPREQITAVRKKYKGTSMWMKAPNGKPTNLTPKQWLQVRTPNFKAWFGDWENDPDNSSQVVDENGEPLVLYHRTQRGNNFSVFRKNSGGIHFGTRRQADDRAKGRLFPVFLNVRNPFRMYDQGAHWNFSNNWTEKTGNDGIVYLNEVEGIEPGTPPQDSWIVFEPNQIKSATKNNGYFDANNPDIYKQTATINNNSLDSNNTVRSVYDFLTSEAQRQVANIKKKYQNTTNWMKAPNGKKSNLNELQWLLVRTDNFKRWFGDWQNNPQEASKVLDANGEPLLVTHQTGGGGFSKFNTTGKFSIYSYKTRGTGAWFADLKDNEPLYSNDKEGENIYHVFLNIRNPFIYDAEGRHWEDIGRIWIADEEGGEPIYYDNDGKPFLYDYQAREYIRTVLRSNPRYYYEHDNRYSTTDDLVRAVRKGRLGNGNHDGVIIRNVGDLGYDNIDDYVIFKPIQVKARDNNGAFSLKNTEIYKQSASDRDIDKQYFDALNSGDMDTARSIVDEQARKKGYYADNEHRGQHQPATSQDGYPNLANVMNSDLVPADYWTHPQYYLYSPEEWDAFYAVTHAIRNKKLLTVYRAVPDDVKETALRNSDWVTPSRDYAVQHGQSSLDGKYRIISAKVALNRLWWDGNSIAELGYDDGKNYVYKNTKNGRKLNDTVVHGYTGTKFKEDEHGRLIRDENGHLIVEEESRDFIVPPSKRFNYRKSEEYYQTANNTSNNSTRTIKSFLSLEAKNKSKL